MNYHTNCLNCGAVLHYDANNHERMAKCGYCGTEYHIDELGRLEEYKVKLMIGGQVREFYVESISCENAMPEFVSCLDGTRFSFIGSYGTRGRMEITLVDYY